jgi:hypothetical protein
MLKQKPKDAPPVLNGGQPELEHVEVKPVDDLMAKMQAAIDAKSRGRQDEPALRADPARLDVYRPRGPEAE